jgi:hypothetical protein
MHAVCPAHLILLDLTILAIFVQIMMLLVIQYPPAHSPQNSLNLAYDLSDFVPSKGSAECVSKWNVIRILVLWFPASSISGNMKTRNLNSYLLTVEIQKIAFVLITSFWIAVFIKQNLRLKCEHLK